jgi:hypothetical protein
MAEKARLDGELKNAQFQLAYDQQMLGLTATAPGAANSKTTAKAGMLTEDEIAGYEGGGGGLNRLRAERDQMQREIGNMKRDGYFD